MPGDGLDWKKVAHETFGLQSEKSAVSPYNLVASTTTGNVLPEKITVYDSTLRDGEQTPGVSFTPQQKMAIARKLDDIGVPQIEAGFPAVSDEERRVVKRISRAGLDAEILALSRASRQDIDAAVDAGADMALLFIATSDIHMRFKLKARHEDILQRTVESVEYARGRGIRVSFSAEDSMRTRLDFLLQVLGAAEGAGASRLGITDTVGCASPEAVSFVVKEARKVLRRPLSIHLHNDFGLALANAIAGVYSGAEAVTTTVSGIGERAGNVPLEQFVVAIKHLYGKDIGIDTKGLKGLCEMVSRFSRIRLPRHQPWVGRNAFSHESGIHVAAILSCPFTYESLPPGTVGNRRTLYLGKHSGATIVRSKLAEMGITANARAIQSILKDVKELGEKRGRVSKKEFREIAKRHLGDKIREMH